MPRFTPVLFALLLPVACGGNTDSDDDSRDGAATGGDDAGGSGGTGGITNHTDGGAPNHTGGVGPGSSAECQAHEATRPSITDPAACSHASVACGMGGAIAIPCDTIVLNLDPPVAADSGRLEVSTNLDVTVGLRTDFISPCGDAELCARVEPTMENIEKITVSWSTAEVNSPEHGGQFPEEVTVAVRDPESNELLSSKTMALEYSCEGYQKWCWQAPPLTVDLSVTAQENP